MQKYGRYNKKKNWKSINTFQVGDSDQQPTDKYNIKVCLSCNSLRQTLPNTYTDISDTGEYGHFLHMDEKNQQQ